jgi:hypothetical protein
MEDPRDAQIAALRAQLAALQPAPEPAPEPEPEPAAPEILAGQELAEPGPAMYGVSLGPDDAVAGVLAGGHEAGDGLLDAVDQPHELGRLVLVAAGLPVQRFTQRPVTVVEHVADRQLAGAGDVDAPVRLRVPDSLLEVVADVDA